MYTTGPMLEVYTYLALRLGASYEEEDSSVTGVKDFMR